MSVRQSTPFVSQNQSGTSQTMVEGVSIDARATSISLFALASLFSAVLLWYFHDRFWYPIDEGNFSTVAQRILSGEVLHLQVQDIHPGYINFLNAAAFRL